jgi:hypothetical protein
MRRNVYKVIKKDRTSSTLSTKSPYLLKYLKSFETKAVPGSLGIFCFKTRRSAEMFVGWYNDNRLIVRVSPIGRGIKPKSISSSRNKKDINRFYEKSRTNIMFSMRQPPIGTICYPSVLVLE